MRICFPIDEDNGMDSRISTSFWSAPKFMVVNPVTEAVIVFHNSSKFQGHRYVPCKILQDMTVDAIIVDADSGKSMDILRESGVEIFQRQSTTVSGTIKLIKSGDFCYSTGC